MTKYEPLTFTKVILRKKDRFTTTDLDQTSYLTSRLSSMTDMKNVQVLLQSLSFFKIKKYIYIILTYFACPNMQTWRSHQTGDILPATVARVPSSAPLFPACSAITGRKERMRRSQGRMMMAGRGSGHHATLNIPDNSFCPTGRRHPFSLHPVNWSWKLLSFLFLWFFPLNCEIFLTHCRFSKNGIKELT